MKEKTFDMATLKKKLSEIEHEQAESQDDCYLQDFPLSIRRRLHALEHLHSKRNQIAAEFRAEVLEIERRYQSKYAPLLEEVATLRGSANF